MPSTFFTFTTPFHRRAQRPASAVLAAALAMALTLMLGLAHPAQAQTPAKVIDLPTRAGVTERFLYLGSAQPRATVVLLAGGHGGLQITPAGDIQWGAKNFLVRTRQQFADAGFAVVVVDAPSDHLQPPFMLGGFRHSAEHTADISAVIAWARQQAAVPVWLVGTSRGTESAAEVATRRTPAQGGPDGVVLTSSILRDRSETTVPQMPLAQLTVPVLVVHHEQDSCAGSNFRELPALTQKLGPPVRSEVIVVSGGQNRGDACEAMAYHGYNGIEAEVVGKIGQFIGTH